MKTKQLFGLVIGCVCSYLVQAQSVNNITNATQFQRDFASAKTTTNHPVIYNGNAEINFNEEKYRKFKKMRTGGIILTGVGVGLITTGVILARNADDAYFDYNFGEDNSGSSSDDNDKKIIGGVACIVFGTLSTGGGITMWAIGSRKMKKYGGGQMSVKPTKNGLGLAYKF